MSLALSRRTRRLAMLLALVALAATFAHPRVALERPAWRYVFVFDISQSMNVADVPEAHPSMTRLELARRAAAGAVAGLPCGTEVGLALFSGHRAFLFNTPLETCSHYRELTLMIEAIDWRMSWEARSEIAKGVFRALELLAQLPGETRLVFITDGQEAPPINPDVPPAFKGKVGAVKGLLVGVGGNALVPIPKLDPDGHQVGVWSESDVKQVDTFTADEDARAGRAPRGGQEHLSSLREGYLQGLAASVGLAYHRLADEGDLARRLRDDSLAVPRTVDTDVRGLFALVALAVFLLALVAPGRAHGAAGSHG